MKPSDIVYENKTHWVCRAGKGFEVYRNGLTHARRCAQIGYEGAVGLKRAIEEADKRDALSPSEGKSNG